MGRVLRPDMRVLPESALVGKTATHVVTSDQPYYWKRPGKSAQPEGTLAAGTRVRLVSRNRGPMCVVEDSHGRKVYTAMAGLRSLNE